MRAWPTFEQDLLESPDETLKCVGLAMHQRLISLPNIPCSQNDGSSDKDFSLQQVYARIQTNFKPVSLNSVRVDRNEKLIVVRGNVVRVGSLEHRATWIAYRCARCSAEQAIKQTKQTETLPRSCPCKNRSSKDFVALVSSPFTSIEACQTIHLQEILFTNHSGRVPRTIKICLEAGNFHFKFFKFCFLNQTIPRFGGFSLSWRRCYGQCNRAMSAAGRTS